MSEQPVVLPISTAKELIDFAHAINKLHNEQQRDLMVTLTNDIDLTGVEWTPIGNEEIPFYGTVDGAGHTISGLHIDKSEGGCCGLFGVCAGTIENLTVTGSITCVAADVHSAVGGIAGLVVGGHISNCTADFTIDSNRLSLGMYAGGVVTRQQVWMILARMSGAEPADMAAAKAWAVANGISDGSNPGSPVTRQQLATLLYRYAALFGYDVSVGESTNILSYADVGQLSEYAIPAMQWACGKGIIRGTGDGSTLTPQGTATRAQLAVMLYRFMGSM